MAEIVANSVLPARREPIVLQTSDRQMLVGELASPEHAAPRGTIVWLHPLPTHGGSTDSHLLRKSSWRLPALADLAVLRFNTRGTHSGLGTSTGTYDESRAEGLDLDAALAFVRQRGLPKPWVVGWSFGTDVALRHAREHDIAGVILLSPPLRWTTPEELARWRDSDLPVVALIPEHDDYLKPREAIERFASVPKFEIIAVPDAKHLWVGETSVRVVLNEIARRAAGVPVPLPETYDGPMERWNDL
jgi:alpha/beta superfamily hydrolase